MQFKNRRLETDEELHVLPESPTYDIGEFGARKDKVVVAVLDEPEVLAENAFDISTSF